MVSAKFDPHKDYYKVWRSAPLHVALVLWRPDG